MLVKQERYFVLTFLVYHQIVYIPGEVVNEPTIMQLIDENVVVPSFQPCVDLLLGKNRLA